MPRTLVDEATYINECNKALQKAVGYRPGMRIVASPHPEKPKGAAGIEFVGGAPGDISIFASAHAEVQKHFELDVNGAARR